MVYCKLEHENKYFRLSIKNENQNRSSVIFVGCIGLIMFLLPILTILFLSIKINFGTILVCILAWFISGYFIRLYLWNKYGKEVFIINEDTLEIYNDYKYFKDNRRFYHFIKIDIIFFFEGNIIYANEFGLDYLDSKSELSELGFKLGEEIITSHEKIPILEIMDIAKQFKSS